MHAPFFIVGPTAVGKSEIAVAVAERCGGEIVNADAFQLYAGLDLLTAKPTREQRRRAPHHLVGTVPLTEAYSVAQFREQARRRLADIARRRRPAIVVGGSGMYVKSLTHGLSPLPPAQPALRAELEAMDMETLCLRLRALDPVTAGVIDHRNRRRLVRAVEVCITTGRPFSDFRDLWDALPAPEQPMGVFLVRDRNDLAERINRRVEGMVAQGLVDEVRAIPPRSLSETASRMIGWREVQDHLAGRTDLATCMDQIGLATRRYAKRQMTWFRRETVFEALPLAHEEDALRAVDLISQRLCADGKPAMWKRDAIADR